MLHLSFQAANEALKAPVEIFVLISDSFFAEQ